MLKGKKKAAKHHIKVSKVLTGKKYFAETCANMIKVKKGKKCRPIRTTKH
jgi:hypothetical protein